MFEETADGLQWRADADEFGDFISGKHKSPVGQMVPWSALNAAEFNMGGTLKSWSQKIESHVLKLNKEDPVLEADRNTLVFDLAELGEQIEPTLLERFVLEACGSYCRRLRGERGTGIFYAWHDEMSGALRMSVSSQEEETSLPFGCQYDVLHDAKTLAQLILESSYRTGSIPAHELSQADFEEEDEADEFILPIFAKQLISLT